MAKNKNVNYIMQMETKLSPEAEKKVLSQLKKMSVSWRDSLEDSTTRAIIDGSKKGMKKANDAARLQKGISGSKDGKSTGFTPSAKMGIATATTAIGAFVAALNVATDKMNEMRTDAISKLDLADKVDYFAKALNTTKGEAYKRITLLQAKGIDLELLLKSNAQMEAFFRKGGGDKYKIGSFDGSLADMDKVLANVWKLPQAQREQALTEIYGKKYKLDYAELFETSPEEWQALGKDIHKKTTSQYTKEMDDLGATEDAYNIKKTKQEMSMTSAYASKNPTQLANAILADQVARDKSILNTLENLNNIVAQESLMRETMTQATNAIANALKAEDVTKIKDTLINISDSITKYNQFMERWNKSNNISDQKKQGGGAGIMGGWT